MKEGKMGMLRKVLRFLEERRVWRLPGLLYADDMVVRGESEEYLRTMVGRFDDVCKRRGRKVNVVRARRWY